MNKQQVIGRRVWLIWIFIFVLFIVGLSLAYVIIYSLFYTPMDIPVAIALIIFSFCAFYFLRLTLTATYNLLKHNKAFVVSNNEIEYYSLSRFDNPMILNFNDISRIYYVYNRGKYLCLITNNPKFKLNKAEKFGHELRSDENNALVASMNFIKFDHEAFLKLLRSKISSND